MDAAATREHVRAERDRHARATTTAPEDVRRPGVPDVCYQAAGGDFLLALAIALDALDAAASARRAS